MKKSILLLTLLFWISSFGFGQSSYWEELNAPPGIINSFEVKNNNHFLASTASHVWETTDASQNWQPLVAATSSTGFKQMVSLDSTRLVLLDSNSLFLFDKISNTTVNITPPGKTIRNIHVNKANQFIFLSASYISGVNTINEVLFSTDEGQSWQVNDPSPFISTLLEMDNHPSGALFVEKVFRYPPSSLKVVIKRSFDGGITWDSLFAGNSTTFFIDKNGAIYCSNYRSDDLGNTWYVAGFPKFATVANSLNHFYTLYHAEDPPEFSIDEGVTWQKLPDYDSTNTYNNGVAIRMDDSGKILLPVDNGVIGKLFRSNYSTLEGVYISGTVEKDGDADCSTLDPEQPLENWIVKAQGADEWFSNTDSSGHYSFFVPPGTYNLNVKPAIPQLWEACDSIQTTTLTQPLDSATLDFEIKALVDCPIMGVDLAISRLPRCFNGTAAISYCNYGTSTADSAHIVLTLDPLIELISASSSYTQVGADQFRFDLGTVPLGKCGSIKMNLVANCDSAQLGQTLCAHAQIYPDSLCAFVPGWSGAELRASVRCQGDSLIIFDVKNAKPVGSQTLGYIVIEDDVVIRSGQNSYDPGQIREMTVENPAGHFYRFQSQQEPGHPFSTQVAAWVEGCGGLVSMGFPNQFRVDNGIPSEDVECTEIVGSYDPNDKQGFPQGAHNEHFIEPGTDLEYLIRFQNTGTAEAHFVVIRDTLSALLDPSTLRPGAASHPYSWKLDGPGILTFRFDDINLPDSFANEPESHGFISFRISQKPDLQLGSVIHNRAGIYFDFNAPVMTNQTWHTLGVDFLEDVSSVEGGKLTANGIEVFPNPATEVATIILKNHFSGKKSLVLTDAFGKTVLNKTFFGGKAELLRGELPAGVYFAKIVENERVVAAGKVVWH